MTVFDAKLGLVAPAAGETELEDLKWAVGNAMGGAGSRGRRPRRYRHFHIGSRAGRDFRCARGTRGRPRARRKGWGRGAWQGSAQPGTAPAKRAGLSERGDRDRASRGRPLMVGSES